MSKVKNADNIIRYTKIATIIFIALVVVADVCGFIITPYIVRVWAERYDDFALIFLSAVYYVGTAGAYVALFSLYKLLNNMSKDIVFDKSNTKLMKIIAICCVLMGIDCVIGTIAWFGTIYLGTILFFMVLIVLCLRAVFEKAIEMKDELDLTI
ncbi:Protein of unknown function [Ruminococcaceae bacterium YRB3002]|nr:Protein of unknown function [Ruminococcaceae bacterium YRB3002]